MCFILTHNTTLPAAHWSLSAADTALTSAPTTLPWKQSGSFPTSKHQALQANWKPMDLPEKCYLNRQPSTSWFPSLHTEFRNRTLTQRDFVNRTGQGASYLTHTISYLILHNQNIAKKYFTPQYSIIINVIAEELNWNYEVGLVPLMTSVWALLCVAPVLPMWALLSITGLRSGAAKMMLLGKKARHLESWL